MNILPKSKASGTCQGWAVEARATLDECPVQLDNQTYTTKWKQVQFPRVEGLGIPVGVWGIDEYLHFGLMSHPAAQALRWWFIAQLKFSHSHAVETRLVRYSVKYERSATREFELDHLDHFQEMQRVMKEKQA